MHRTRFSLDVTTPVGPGADWATAQMMAEKLEDLLPPGSTVSVGEPEELEEDTSVEYLVREGE